MTFGDGASFAISLELDQEYGKAWLFGKICYWIGGREVGEWTLGTSLRDAIWSITTFVKDNGRRENDSLFHLPTDTAFHRIDRCIYGSYDVAPEDVIEFAAWYDICPNVDVFSGWKVYLVECGSQARFLYQDPNDQIAEFRLPAGEFDRVIRAAFDQLDAWYEHEVPDDTP